MKVTVEHNTDFFFNSLFCFLSKSVKRQTNDEVLTRNGQVRTEGTDTDVREEAKESARCFFTDLWRLNGDRGGEESPRNTMKGYEHVVY